MKKTQIIILALVSVFIFFLLYAVHIPSPLPLHIDEWHHITQASKLREGIYTGGVMGYEIGFHVFLAFLSYFANLVLIYKFLPALWAVFSALILFYIVSKKTNNFTIAIFAMLFFASIKSNANITGLWFFTPLTFAIPFIFLYIYLFTEAIETQNKKLLLASLAIMLFLIPIHSISVLFALPFLALYSLFNFKQIKKQWKILLLFLLIPIIGILFYTYMTNILITNSLSYLFNSLQFRYKWGVLELNNSFLELYSLAGYLLAGFGIALLIIRKKTKKYLPYLLWPATLLISILIYRITGTSYLSPYQRNLYYFALSLPILSSLGLHYLVNFFKSYLQKIKTYKQNIFKAKTALTLFILLIMLLTFQFYFYIPESLSLYKTVDTKDYEALLFLSHFPKSKILANPFVSTGIYPISGHEPVGTVLFYGNRTEVENFFSSQNCETKQETINKHNVKYVLSKEKIECNYTLIYNENNYIYKVNQQ